MGEADVRSALLLGRDHPVYGEIHCVVLAGGRTAAAITVGDDPHAPSLRGKGDVDQPNEDALLARDDDRRVMMAVADAHYGIDASHELLQALDAALEDIPSDPADLELALTRLSPSQSTSGSETTLLVAIHDRRTHVGFGLSFGDSSLVLTGPRGSRTVNVREVQYVDPTLPRTYDPGEAFPFHFLTEPGELILAFTDGIDQCHYRSPDTSITPRHLSELYARTGAHPEAYAVQLMEMALDGVDGHPGGQDNAALVVSSA